MRSSLVAVVLACAACNATPSPPAPQVQSTRTPKSTEPVDPPPLGVPHGGSIQHVAVTEQADAAVSLDDIGGIRLWPALDGTREPIPIQLPNAREVAISHAGHDVLVAILDVAGSLRLIRYTREGVVRGAAQVPGEAAIELVVAIEGGVLVARSDRTIERYDEAGVLHGRIAMEPGEEIGALAARRDGAAVLTGYVAVGKTPAISGGTRGIRPGSVVRTTTPAEALRWIDLADGLHWGSRVVLAAGFDLDQLAISPNHRRFAAVAQADHRLHIFDGTGSKATLVEGSFPNGISSDDTTMAIGFVDDDHAARASSGVEWWVASSADSKIDPWHVDVTKLDIVASESAAIGDGLVVSGHGASLALHTMSASRFLGWRSLASGALATTIAGSVTLDDGQRLLVLDRRLERTSEIAFEGHGYAKPLGLWWIDANHAVMEQPAPSGSDEAQREQLELVDFRHEARRVPLGTYAHVQRVAWNAEVRTLAVVGDGTLERSRLDLETNTLVKLPAIKVPATVEVMELLDPVRADGASLVVSRTDERGQLLGFWVSDTPTTDYRLPPNAGAVLEGLVVGTSPTGAIFVENYQGVVMRRRTERKLFPHLQAERVSTDRTGTRILVLYRGQVTLLGPSGTELWRQRVWGAQLALFSPDGTQVVIGTSGGIVALDANTGVRTAMACGFSFGLMTKPPETTPHRTVPVCEELER